MVYFGLTLKAIGEDREADVALIRRSLMVTSYGAAVVHASFEASVEPPGQNGCLLVTLIARFWRSSRLLPFFLFAHVPLRGCSDPSIFLLVSRHAITIDLARRKLSFPFKEMRRRALCAAIRRRTKSGGESEPAPGTSGSQ